MSQVYDPNDPLNFSNRRARVDLPPEAYLVKGGPECHPFQRRPGFNTAHPTIRVGINQYRVNAVKLPLVFQYDISIQPEPKSAIVYKKCWMSKKLQEKVKAYNKGPWICDMRKIAWSTNDVDEIHCQVDLGEEEGKAVGRPNNVFMVMIRKTNKINLEILNAYLDGKLGWDSKVLECMSFLDHVIRQGPSENWRLIKRTLFNEASETERLNNYSEAIKGIYSAIRLNSSKLSGGFGLGINVDVSNQTFFVGQDLHQLARNLLNYLDQKWAHWKYDEMVMGLYPVRNKQTNQWEKSEALKALRRLTNIKFRVSHRGKENDPKEYKLKGFMFGQTYGDEGANAKQVTFVKKKPDGTEKETTVFQYYIDQYRKRMKFWQWPLVETHKGGSFPMEFCVVDRFNPYPFKLDAVQTADMIKFAVQRPPQRRNELNAMVANLNWPGDKYIRHFGIQVNPQMPLVEARLIPNPVIQFGQKTLDPKMTGRWDLRGQRFVQANAVPLKSWCFVAVGGCVDKPTIDNFVKAFKTAYQGHGGRIERDPVVILAGPRNNLKHDAMVMDAYKHCGDKNQMVPQIMFFILWDKTSWVYDRLKKNADVRTAVPTQMLQASHVKKAQPQYCSNVCMKVNAKLGGQTSRIATKGPKGGSAFFRVPTMMIGCDISHGSDMEGNDLSVAALTVSMDKDAAVYCAGVQTNGRRVEIVQPAIMHTVLGPMVEKWQKKNGCLPQHVFYLRDGVSEGQFAHVMQYEYLELKRVFNESFNHNPKITIIVCTKRHHIRFFPEKGDKNGNALPGTLLEKEVTHPFYYDFYLCSHVAIQGTARPVHYNVLFDQCQLKPAELQQILYHQCYQYCRSTTPVSLHPAVYYAHLASARGRHHEARPTSEQVPKNVKYRILPPRGLYAKRPEKDESQSSAELRKKMYANPLLEIGDTSARPESIANFKSTMWYV
ncbi:Piwi domain-containing protein [Cladorrhinum sp. PSN332]|nr:Piwi domain-containing protein [Cladorrhinum sp. PSN332]